MRCLFIVTVVMIFTYGANDQIAKIYYGERGELLYGECTFDVHDRLEGWKEEHKSVWKLQMKFLQRNIDPLYAIYTDSFTPNSVHCIFRLPYSQFPARKKQHVEKEIIFELSDINDERHLLQSKVVRSCVNKVRFLLYVRNGKQDSRRYC